MIQVATKVTAVTMATIQAELSLFKLQRVITPTRFVYKDVLEKVQIIAKYSRKWPTRNGLLQSNVTKKHGKEIKLMLDVKIVGTVCRYGRSFFVAQRQHY